MLVVVAAGLTVVPTAHDAAAEARERPLTSAALADADLICDRVLEDFSQSAPGSFPQGWRTKQEHHGQEAREKKIYVVEKSDADQRPVLHARYGTHTITVVRPLPPWDLAQYPVLAWRWKAVQLPQGGDESDIRRNDSAASVYLVWETGLPFKISYLRFAWSSTLPVGREIKRRLGHARIRIEASGLNPAQPWQEARVDVQAQAGKLLDDARPPSPVLLALTTDADATASQAEAFYADFRLCRRRDPGATREAAPKKP